MIWYRRLLWLATGLTLVVVVLGAYVRLSDAGLGCPDWPGCYGELIPTGIEDGDQRGDEFPTRPVVETDKAWKEMIHRYAASTLGFSIILIALLAWRNREQPGQAGRSSISCNSASRDCSACGRSHCCSNRLS